MFKRCGTEFLYRISANPSLTRSVYVSTKPGRTRRRTTQLRSSSLDDAEKQLDSQLQELRQQELKLRKFLRDKEDEKRQKTLIREDNLETSGPASDHEIAAIEKGLRQLPLSTGDKKSESRLFSSSRKGLLPSSIQKKISPSQAVQLLVAESTWPEKISLLQNNGGFSGVPVEDVGRFLHQIPLDVRALNVERLEEMVNEAGITLSASVTDALMAGYAQNGSPENVERLVALDSSSVSPFTFGHLAKAYFKTRNIDEVGRVLDRMNEKGLAPTLPIYTTVIQACIQNRQYKRALKIFDNLKYMAVKTQPDVKLYNAMMLAASKERNINKVLDLFREMTSRAVDPLIPDAESYNTLVYACSRDEKTQLQAWKYFIEMLDAGLSTGRHTMNALLYLCASTGELLLTRALFKQLCLRPESYPDGFALNCLFTAYSRYNPSTLSTVLESPYGPKIRSKVVIQTANDTPNPAMMPPMLPLTILSPEMILAESAALVQFFSEKAPQTLWVQKKASASTNSPVLFNFVHLPAKLGNFEEYKRRYLAHTFSWVENKDTETKTIDTPVQLAIPRDTDVYRQALLAATDARDLDFARQVWEERGAWRHTPAFRMLPKEKRDTSDVRFARDMVKAFAACGEVENALRLVMSSCKYFRWRRVHLQPLIDICIEHEDFASLKEINKLLGWYWRREQKLLHEKA